MNIKIPTKSTVEEIRTRFDADVERFSNLETGQSATVDAPLAMELITRSAMVATPRIDRVLDIGCGAGNNAVRLAREYNGDFACDLCDLSSSMLDRAQERLSRELSAEIRTFHGDFRDIDFEAESYDVIIAAAVLHHLRDDADWEFAFEKIHHLLRPGGGFWVTDLVAQETAGVEQLIWKKYGDYLESLGGPDYREEVFRYIAQEDSPRSLTYQIELLRKVGFQTIEILHKNSCFAAFGAIKA